MIDRLQKAFDAQLTELGKILTNGSQRWLKKALAATSPKPAIEI